ncbi:carbohydrate kinase [Methylotenera sp.]|uniref:carbohydrate kinase family protein n=1 Tax=Methylotenera sp. TaxID=2051956 RepID=UPI002489E775|nr:carbohydrate kinase [Methylotenera sp.]MDI1298549.1 carbohydrate kinase [Methylotenera sp.]
MIQKKHASDLSTKPKASKHTIALFGEMLADIFPDRAVLGGAPYNVANHLQAFGQHPVLITRTGNDPLRDEFLADMARLGMDDSGVQCDQIRPTGQVIVHMDENNHRFEILPEQAYDHIHSGVVHLVTMAMQPDMVYYGTLAQRGVESRLALDTFLSDTKSPRFLDINLRHPWYDKHIIRRSLLRANIVKINEEELKLIAGLLKLTGFSAKDHGLSLIAKFDLTCLIVTCGSDGAWMLSKEGKEARVSGFNLNGSLVDTVGAGDGFAAVCILGILENWLPEVMLTRASVFAAALCGIRGAVPNSSDFYLPFLEGEAYGKPTE